MKLCMPMLSIGLICLLFAACSTQSQTVNWAKERNMRKPNLTVAKQLLLEEEGWQVWRLATRRSVRCIAVKPANSRSWPEFTWDIVPVNGGAGFYMLWEEKWKQPYLGFYGAYPFGKVALVWRDGESVLETNNREAVFSWQGETLDFEVTTQPLPEVYAESLTVSGQLDFTGVQQAYNALEECYQWQL